LGIVVIVDMEHFSPELLHPPTFRIYLWLLSRIQELFPDLVRKIYLINCPAIIASIYALVKGVLAEQTRQKIVFTDQDWRQTLCDDLGKENILRPWGGDKISKITPVGSIRMGGDVPKHLRYKIQNHTFEEQLNKVVVGARASTSVEVSVTEEGTCLKWFFKLSHGDIDFKIVKDDREVCVFIQTCMRTNTYEARER
uniref:CRAL-TRIO domain-containing protein n=1 Tax=Gongylonema pulchrum TaxID=637853 RepID=A0A183EKR2_9BILA